MATMSTREKVEYFIKQGKTTKEIGRILGLTVDGVRYHRESGKQTFMRKRCKLVAIHRVKIKMKAVDYSGSNCLKCGYNACLDCMTFHHVDPDKKESKVIAGGWTLSWKRVKPEIDKTVLLCNRCHTEHHAGYWSFGSDLIQRQEFLRSKYQEKDLDQYEAKLSTNYNTKTVFEPV